VTKIKLLFEPQGRGFSELEFIDHRFYTVDRLNQCVVCGNSEKYLKFHIVPLIYRQYFPNSFKSHRSHDIVLLCFRCHEAANKEVEKLRIQIAKEFDVPLFESNEKLSLRNKIISFTK
jgi:5-methylcytosine-specific restriction endonuclease McrA